MSSLQRVVVTGLGQVSALGTTLEQFSEGIFAGTSAISEIEGLDTPGLLKPIGGKIPRWDSSDWLPATALRTSWLVTHYAYAASLGAFESAGLDVVERPRGGIYLGTGFGGQGAIEETYRACFSSPGTRPRPAAIPIGMTNASAGFLATELRLKGPNITFVTACSSATHAIGQACHLLRTGTVDVMLAGGTDAPLTGMTLAAWNAMKVLAPVGEDPSAACRPFDANRKGLVVGEGAGMLVLETLEHARARGAAIHAEVVGYGATADAGHITHPDIDGITACMDLALDDAGLEPHSVGYVNAHGTATLINDRTETHALAKVFGDHAPGLMVSSTKSVVGHTMGAAGGLEAIATVLALREGRVPPTANLETRDPALPDLDYVTGEARRASVDAAMSTSFGFGGNNAALVLQKI